MKTQVIKKAPLHVRTYVTVSATRDPHIMQTEISFGSVLKAFLDTELPFPKTIPIPADDSNSHFCSWCKGPCAQIVYTLASKHDEF